MFKRQYRFIVILIFVRLTLANPSIAQINESDTTRFQLRASVTGNYQEGNVNLFLVRGKLDVSLRLNKHIVFKSQNANLYQEFSNNKADNDIFSRNYLYLNPTKKWYPFIITYINTNFRRKIDYRYFTGIGGTYRLFNNVNNTIKISLSAVQEKTHFNTSTFNDDRYNGSNSIELCRSTLYLGGWYYVAKTKLRFYYDAYYQIAMNYASNYRSQIDVGIDFPVWKGLAFNSSFNFTHENIVPLGIEQQDKIVSLGCSYSLRKK